MNITCIIHGSPLPERVTWKKKSNAKAEYAIVDISDSYNETISTMEVQGKTMKVFILTIEQLDAKMDGDEYKCTPPNDSNLAADQHDTVKLKVEEKSEPCTLIHLNYRCTTCFCACMHVQRQ